MHVPPPDLRDGLAYVQDSNGFLVPVQIARDSVSDESFRTVLDDDMDEPLIYQNVDELEREFEAWNAETEKKKAIAEAERMAIQEEAVKTWKDQLLRDLEVRRQKTESERSSLRAELTKQRVAPQQIEDIINHLHPQEQADTDIQLVSRNIAGDKASIVALREGPAEPKSSRWWSIRSRK